MSTHEMENDTLRQREDRLRAIFKQYFPDPKEKEIFFWDDEDLSSLNPDLVEKLKKSNDIAIYDEFFFFSHFNNIEIMTIEFFRGIAIHYAQRMVESLLYGPNFEGKRMPFIGAASHLSYQGYIWTLAFRMAAKHGFVYEDTNNDVYTHVYHSLFSWVFHEYDDYYRDRLNRADLYLDLTRWDARVKDNIKRYAAQDSGEAQQQMYQAILENAKKYTFTGDDKMGTFINGFGYFKPYDRKPIYINCIFPSYDDETDDRTIYRKNLDTNLEFAVRDLLVYFFNNNMIDPDMSRFKFTKLDKERKALVISDSIKEAIDEQVYAELAVVLACCNQPVPAPDELIVFYSEPEPIEEQTTEEEEDANDADN